jgi:hypothetical protein
VAALDAGGGLARLGRKRPSGLGFERGLHGENTGATGIASKGFGRGAGAGEGRTAVARGRGAPARNRARGKAGKRGKIGRRGPLPHGGTPAAARGDRGAARRRRLRAAEVQRR